MGVAYRATYAKLNRDVTMKVLPEAFRRPENHLVLSALEPG
jgi:hypothetical protein